MSDDETNAKVDQLLADMETTQENISKAVAASVAAQSAISAEVPRALAVFNSGVEILRNLHGDLQVSATVAPPGDAPGVVVVVEKTVEAEA